MRPELELDEGVSAVLQVQDGICFEAVAVAVVRNGPPRRCRVRLEIPYAEALEQETQSLEVGIEVGRQQAERRDSDGGIHQIALARRPDRRLRADGGRPCGDIQHDPQLLEGLDILGERGVTDFVVRADIGD